MIGEEVTEKRKISFAEALNLLEKRKKVGALSYSQQTSYDYCKKFVALPYDETNELLEKLLKLSVPRDVAINIVDVFPKNKLTLKVIMAKSESDVDKVMEILDEYRDKSKQYRVKISSGQDKENEVKKESKSKSKSKKEEPDNGENEIKNDENKEGKEGKTVKKKEEKKEKTKGKGKSKSKK